MKLSDRINEKITLGLQMVINLMGNSHFLPYLQVREHEEEFLRCFSLHRSVKKKTIIINNNIIFRQHYSYMYRYSNTVSNVLINHSNVSYLKSVKSLVYALVEITSHFITFLDENTELQ